MKTCPLSPTHRSAFRPLTHSPADPGQRRLCFAALLPLGWGVSEVCEVPDLKPSLSPPPYHCFFCVQTLLLLSGFFLFLSFSLSLTVSLSLPLFPSLAQCSYGC